MSGVKLGLGGAVGHAWSFEEAEPVAAVVVVCVEFGEMWPLVSIGKIAFPEGAKRADRDATIVTNTTVAIASRAHFHLLMNMIVFLNMYTGSGGNMRQNEREEGVPDSIGLQYTALVDGRACILWTLRYTVYKAEACCNP